MNWQLHCALMEVWDHIDCVQFSARPTYKGIQQTIFGLLEELDTHPDHGPKICKLVQKFALCGK